MKVREKGEETLRELKAAAKCGGTEDSIKNICQKPKDTFLW